MMRQPKKLRHKSCFSFFFCFLVHSFFNDHTFLLYFKKFFCFEREKFFTITELYENIRDGGKKICYFYFYFLLVSLQHIVKIWFIKHISYVSLPYRSAVLFLVCIL